VETTIAKEDKCSHELATHPEGRGNGREEGVGKGEGGAGRWGGEGEEVSGGLEFG